MSKRIILLDFDGPINDVSKRYFEVHQFACQSVGYNSTLDCDTFWEMKRRKMPISELLPGLTDLDLAVYRTTWMKHIETQACLKHDKIFSFASNVLCTLKIEFDLWLVSLRGNSQGAQSQLKLYGITDFFDQILFVQHDKDGGMAKAEAVLANLKHQQNLHCFVGDTEVDISAAAYLGTTSYSVLSGIRTRTVLEKFIDTIIVKDLADFENVINQ